MPLVHHEAFTILHSNTRVTYVVAQVWRSLSIGRLNADNCKPLREFKIPKVREGLLVVQDLAEFAVSEKRDIQLLNSAVHVASYYADGTSRSSTPLTSIFTGTITAAMADEINSLRKEIRYFFKGPEGSSPEELEELEVASCGTIAVKKPEATEEDKMDQLGRGLDLTVAVRK